MNDATPGEPRSGGDLPEPATGSGPSDPGADEPAAEQDLRATGDEIRQDLRRLGAVENEKQSLDAEDPRVGELSRDAVAIADRIARETRAERQLSDEIG